MQRRRPKGRRLCNLHTRVYICPNRSLWGFHTEEALFLKVWRLELRRVRESFGLTQSELAMILGTTQKQISRVENGSNTSFATVHAWYVACEVELPIPDRADE